MTKFLRFSCCITIAVFTACQTSQSNFNYAAKGYRIAQWNKALTNVVVTDIFPPTTASRIYAYSNIATFGAIQNIKLKNSKLNKHLKELKELPRPKPNTTYDPEAAGLFAFCTVAAKLVYSEEMVIDLQKRFVDSLKQTGINAVTLENSRQYGKAIAQSVLKWAASDGFASTRKMTRYTPLASRGSWQPTPPDYMPASEPFWALQRTFALDSSNQITTPGPTLYNLKKNSPYMVEVNELYRLTTSLTAEQKAIALFWDDNPNTSHHGGHGNYFTQKINPISHWMDNVSNIIEKEGTDIYTSSRVAMVLSVAMSDALKACWQQKFKYNTVRPITIINNTIDRRWNPLIQTPPFPEYPSGHSTVSAAAATVLTHFWGNNYTFTDSCEVAYGSQLRKFRSFKEAANEAALSRLYGGIHYSNSNKQGAVLGENVAKVVLKKLAND